MTMPEHTPAPTPSRAVYGFALYLTFKMLFVLYFLWAIVPAQWFTNIGIYALPQRYWAIAIPMFLLTTLAIFAFIIYPSLGLCMTPRIDDLCTVTDKMALTNDTQFATPNQEDGRCLCKDLSKCQKKVFNAIKKDIFYNNAVPTMYDLAITSVSEHLYL